MDINFDMEFVNNVDFSNIDYILISSLSDIMILLLILKMIKGEKTKVLMSQSVKQIGEVMMLDLIQKVEERNKEEQ